MSGVTVSTRRNRVYPHKFDHDLARVMRNEGGLSINEIARQLGVSVTGVRIALYPHERAANIAGVRTYQRSGKCIDCGAQISRNASRPVNRCRDCWAIQHSIQTCATARPETLRCSSCSEWKPDDDYSITRRHLGRRLRSGECKECTNARRRAARAAKASS